MQNAYRTEKLLDDAEWEDVVVSDAVKEKANKEGVPYFVKQGKWKWPNSDLVFECAILSDGQRVFFGFEFENWVYKTLGPLPKFESMLDE